MFAKRSSQKELLDAEEIPQKDLFRNLYELNRINHLLGGHAVTLKGLEKLDLKKDKFYQILDIGCGGGDTLKAIAKWGRAKGYQFELTGVDLKADCIEYATAYCKNYSEINFKQNDYRNLPALNIEFDIIVTSLFCHHLSDDEIGELFLWGSKQAKIAFIVNDLHRHSFAYYSINFLTKVFSTSYLVKHDAKLSVLRGFSKAELLALANGFVKQSFTLKWVWAFRWLLVYENKEK